MSYDISLADFLLLSSITLLLWLVSILRGRIVKLERKIEKEKNVTRE